MFPVSVMDAVDGLPAERVPVNTGLLTGNPVPVPVNVQVVLLQLTPAPVNVNAPVTLLMDATPAPVLVPQSAAVALTFPLASA
jgi:hypothetical protein